MNLVCTYVLAAIFIVASNASAELTVQLYAAPPSLFIKEAPADEADDDPFSAPDFDPPKRRISYRPVKNTFPSTFPGRLYNVTPLIKEHGALKAEQTIALLNPESSTLIVRGDEEDHELVETWLAELMWTRGAGYKLKLELEKYTEEGEKKLEIGSWTVSVVSGRPIELEMAREDFRASAWLMIFHGVDGEHHEVRLRLDVQERGRSFAIKTDFMTGKGVAHKLDVKSKPETKEEVSCLLTITDQLPSPSLYPSKASQKRAIQAIEGLLPRE